MSELIVLAKIVAKNDSIDVVKSELLKIVGPTVKEDGCLQYTPHQDNENPAVFVLYERWENEDYLAAHMNTAHFKAFVAGIDGHSEGLTVNKLTKIL